MDVNNLCNIEGWDHGCKQTLKEGRMECMDLNNFHKIVGWIMDANRL